jgi:hypothetical protein
MIDFIALLLVAMLGAVLYWHAIESASWQAERAELLNRIMARNYTDFVYSKPTEHVETPQMYTDADEAAWHAKNRKEHPDLYPEDVEAVV